MLLNIENLHLKIDKKEILKGLNLKIKKGEVYCLIGKNGAGESTLSQAIMGVYNYKGSIYLDNKCIDKMKIDERARIGIALAWQKPISIEGITIENYIKLSNKDAEVDSILKFVGLDPKEYKDRMLDDKLSGGERKLIELASVIAMKSKLIILDEPDSGIDVIGISLVKKIIKRLKEEEKGILLITHREEMVKTADKAGIMCNGKIVKEGNPDEIYEHLKKMCNICKR